jgi:hypothetical protein
MTKMPSAPHVTGPPAGALSMSGTSVDIGWANPEMLNGSPCCRAISSDQIGPNRGACSDMQEPITNTTRVHLKLADRGIPNHVSCSYRSVYLPLFLRSYNCLILNASFHDMPRLRAGISRIVPRSKNAFEFFNETENRLCFWRLSFPPR